VSTPNFTDLIDNWGILGLWHHSGSPRQEQNAKAPDDLDFIDACHLSSALIVDEETVGMQALVERHRFELALPQTRSRNHEFLQINVYHFAPEIGFQSICFGLSRHNTLPKDSGRDTHFLEELVEEREGVTRSERHKREVSATISIKLSTASQPAPRGDPQSGSPPRECHVFDTPQQR
jgi:hypothetical protein